MLHSWRDIASHRVGVATARHQDERRGHHDETWAPVIHGTSLEEPTSSAQPAVGATISRRFSCFSGDLGLPSLSVFGLRSHSDVPGFFFAPSMYLRLEVLLVRLRPSNMILDLSFHCKVGGILRGLRCWNGNLSLLDAPPGRTSCFGIFNVLALELRSGRRTSMDDSLDAVTIFGSRRVSTDLSQ